MKLAFLLTQSLDSPGGLGRFFPIACQLAQRGHQVSVFALKPDFASLSRNHFQQQDVDIHYVAQMHVMKVGNLKTYYSPSQLLKIASQAAWKLSLAALHSKADAICICKPHPMNSIAGLAAHYLRGKTLFLDCDDFEADTGHFNAGWQQKGVALFETWMPKRVTLITTNTFVNRDRLLALGIKSSQIYYLPNGVERQRFLTPQANQLADLRQKLGLFGKKVVLFLGSLSMPSHPVNLLVDAFKRLLQSQSNVRLLIVGGGDEYQRLQKQVHELDLDEFVIFTGRVAPEQTVLYYYLANVSVDPIQDDLAAYGRLPLKIFESWACGIPIVTSPVGDRQTIFGNPAAGILCKPGDSVSLAQAIERVLKDQYLSQVLSDYGKQRMENYYWDKLVEGLERIYLEKLSTARPK